MKPIRPKKIDSPRNPVIKEAAQAGARRARYRGEAFIAEGPNLVEAALASGSRGSVQRLFYTAAYMERDPATLERLLKDAPDAEVFELGARAMERICDTETPQGIAVLASCRPASLDELDLSSGPVVVSDRISDPGNMGTLVRTSDALGATGLVVLEGSTDPFGPKALRGSAGSVFSLPVAFATEAELAAWLEEKGARMVAASAGEGVPVYEAELAGPVALVFGNESGGVSASLTRRAGLVVNIPITGSAESLNVATSAALLLYERMRQCAHGTQ